MSTELFHYLLIHWLISIIPVSLGIFVLSKDRQNPLYLAFLRYNFVISWWGVFTLLMEYASTNSTALFWDRISLLGIVFIPPTFLQFTWMYSGSSKIYPQVIRVCYLISSIFFCLVFTPLMARSATERHIIPYFTDPGIAYHVFVIYFSAVMGYGNILVVKAWVNSNSTERKKGVYLFLLATTVSTIGGGGNFLVPYKIYIPILFPYGGYAFILYGILITYTILKYSFLEIEIFIKKTLVFAGLSFILFGIFMISAFVATTFLQTVLGKSGQWILFAVVSAMTAAIIRPLDTFLVNTTDRFLFQKKFDYHKLLRESSKQMAFIQSFNDLAKQIVVFLLKQGRIKNAAMLVPSADQKAFILNYPLGYGGKNARPQMILELNHPLIQRLEKRHAPMELDEIDSEIKAKSAIDSVETRELELMRDTFLSLRAVVVIPAFLSVSSISSPSLPRPAINLRTILVLGPKKSDEPYTEEDLNVFFTLAQESAIAVENARLYDEAVKRAQELEHINREMNLASSRLLKALAETEEANKRLKDTQSQLVHEQKMATLGRLAASVGHEVNNPLTVLSMNISRVLLRLRREPELKVDEILPVFDKMEHNIARIKAVVNTLTGLLKKSERGRFEALSVKILIEETLPLVQFQTYLDNLSGTEVEFDIPADTWLVKGDLERLQEVFLNLFINAYQAMQGHNERKIRITAHNEIETKRVIIEFSDNGCGMTEEIVKKIFNFRFTTKKEGKGSGIGLYMCRYIIELHGGEISVRSKPEEGATFIVKLPMFEELRGRSVLSAAGGTQ